MTYSAKVIAHSKPENGGKDLITMELRYPRFIHSEFMTHRVFSRNASSSRAIPVKKMLAQVWSDPAMPVYWGKNQAGMQAKEELTGWKKKAAILVWRLTGKIVCISAWLLNKLSVHKQLANRLLEPWQYISVIVTATELDNFFTLRDHPDAQPEIQTLAKKMKEAISKSQPQVLPIGGWHLPYINSFETVGFSYETLAKMSAARCARVSYLTHDGRVPSLTEDLGLFDRLIEMEPMHASPIEHQAKAVPCGELKSNFSDDWTQYRKIVEQQKGW